MITTIKKQLHLSYSKIISCDNSLALGVAVFLIFVSIGLINLNFHYPLWIDDEAQNYGNMGTAILDGNISQISSMSSKYMPREGSEFLLSPLIALAFSFLGENYYSLQKTGVLLTGFWAVVWFLVACQLFKERKIWLASLFSLATPLIHLQRSPISLIFTHVGVSILFGLSIFFLLKSQGLENNKKKLFILISGLIYSISFFYGPISLLLIPMILILFLKRGLRAAGLFWWVLGFLIAFIFYFQYYDWFFLKNAAHIKMESDQTTISVFFSLLIYFGGILKNEALKITRIGNPSGVYSFLSVFYLVFLMIVCFYHFAVRLLKERWRLLKVRNISVEFIAFFAGSMFFLAVVAHFRYTLTLHAFDGLRYLISLIPFYLLVLGYFLINNYNKAFVRSLFLVYFGFTVFIVLSSSYPFQKSNKEIYIQISGFNTIYLLKRPELATQINLENAADNRLGRYALTIGSAYAKLPYDFFTKRAEIERQLSTKPANVKQHALDEFVRGYHFQKGLSLDSCQAIQEFFEKNKYKFDSLVAQGLGMGIANKGMGGNDININPESKCLEKIYNLSDKDTLRNLGWGYGRHFHYAGLTQFPISDKLKEISGLYEGVLEGKSWAQKNYHSLDPFYAFSLY